ncbi:ATP-binding protein [Sphingobacterium sp. SG20118]|uniref:ATP-binding protein n=1 Tax=Sphingobacterium sp. SG20118 TaxID=3367156 RepID=UPI0037DFBEFC
MKLETVKISNFRCYKDEIAINVSDLTTIVGKNDAGKSTILEALEIFFNNNSVKIDISDINVYSEFSEVTITCEFSELPSSVILDSGAVTNFQEEYLLNNIGRLEIKKVYDCSKKTPTSEIYIKANHPSIETFDNLLELKEKELQALVKKYGLDTTLKGNPSMRKAIWASVGDLSLKEVDIPVSKAKEDRKRLWEQIDSYLPFYALFQSDRSSKDGDNEVQDPMKVAITTALAEVQDEIRRIQEKVKEKAIEIANNTHEALKKLDASMAKSLEPQFTPPTPANWNSLFKVKMDTHDGISLNKRGSGVRRMILVSFFKAEAERRLKTSNKRSIIYAIEEPETAQHPNNQKILINAFKSLSMENGCQVLLTTHSPGLASELPVDSIRYIHQLDGNIRISENNDVFRDVANTLGVIADSRVKLLICVEGPNDVDALRCLSKALHDEDTEVPNLFIDDRFAFIPLGGGTLKHWVNENYLRALNCKEFHLYDSDVNTYKKSIDDVNSRGDGSYGILTQKLEMECYLHSDAIKEGCGVDVEVLDGINGDGHSLPKVFGIAYSKEKKLDGVLKDNTSKSYLAERAFPKMTSRMIQERDSNGEVKGWFLKMLEMLN